MQELLTLKEYTRLAEQFICYNFRAKSFGQLRTIATKFISRGALRDDELIGEVVQAMARADVDYDPDHPSKASLKTFRYRYAFAAIKSWARKARKHYTQTEQISSEDVLPLCRDKDRLVQDEDYQFLVKKLSNSTLTETQAKVIRLRVVENLTWQSIGSSLNMSRQGAEQNYAKGIRKLRNAA